MATAGLIAAGAVGVVVLVGLACWVWWARAYLASAADRGWNLRPADGGGTPAETMAASEARDRAGSAALVSGGTVDRR